MNKTVKEISDKIVDFQIGYEKMKLDMSSFRGNSYIPNFDLKELFELKQKNDESALDNIIKTLNIEYIDDSWSKADQVAVYIAGSVALILDILITQTNILRPIDVYIRNFLSTNPKMVDFKQTLDDFSNGFRNGKSAPIDFQGFAMRGNKSIHEQYSYGHDPLRFIEGTFQIMTGKYEGVDRYGNTITTPFGEGISDPITAFISYVAHMISDFCNKLSLPYPGSTLLMQFGSDEVREQLAAAYRGNLFNCRTFVYQCLPSLFIDLIIKSWAIYSYWEKTKKINLFAADNLKFESMLLTSNAIITTSNLTITGVRSLLGDPTALFRINWPSILSSIRHAFNYLKLFNKRIDFNDKKIDELYQKTMSQKVIHKSREEYCSDLDKEFEEYYKKYKKEKK